MDRLLALFVAVDDQVKIVAGFCDQCDKLLSFSGLLSKIIHQCKVSVRRQTVYFRDDLRFTLKQAAEGRQKCRHIGSCDIKAVALRCFRRGDLVQPHILPADVGDIRRKLDLIPAILLAEHLDLRAVRKTGNNVIPDAGTGADIQIAAVRCYSSGQDSLLCLLILISDFHSAIRDRDMKCRKKISKELRILHQEFQRLRIHISDHRREEVRIPGNQPGHLGKCFFLGYFTFCFTGFSRILGLLRIFLFRRLRHFGY